MADGVVIRPADRSDDAGIRTLLREVSMEGDIALSLQCEPSYFDAVALEGDDHRTVVATDAGRVIGVGSASIRQRYVNGQAMRVAYLSRLRMARSYAGRFDVIRRGYQALADEIRSLRPSACFTSIAKDNHRARNLLERRIRGLPTYRPIGEIVTCVFQSGVTRFWLPPAIQSVRGHLRRQGISLRHGDVSLRDAAISAGERCGPAYQLSPYWTRNELDHCLSHRGMHDNHFRLLFEDGRPLAVAALWDQRPMKQAVVAGYSARLSRLRWLHNLAVGLRHHGVPLPRAGSMLSQAFVSHVATPIDRPDLLADLVLLLTASARTMGVRLLTLGLDARDSRLPLIRKRFRPITYSTILYAVHFADMPMTVLDDRLLYPDIALL
jgi:hypothetical protein